MRDPKILRSASSTRIGPREFTWVGDGRRSLGAFDCLDHDAANCESHALDIGRVGGDPSACGSAGCARDGHRFGLVLERDAVEAGLKRIDGASHNLLCLPEL